jgi:hypothetical protein
MANKIAKRLARVHQLDVPIGKEVFKSHYIFIILYFSQTIFAML